MAKLDPNVYICNQEDLFEFDCRNRMLVQHNQRISHSPRVTQISLSFVSRRSYDRLFTCEGEIEDFLKNRLHLPIMRTSQSLAETLNKPGTEFIIGASFVGETQKLQDEVITSKNRINLEEEVKRNEEFIHDNKNDLLDDETYYGKFVAILNQKIIDKDDDKITLLRRVFKKYGDQYKEYGDIPVFIELIDKVKQTARFPTNYS